MKLGAHLSIAGGLYKALESANAMGANCLQIFSGSPRVWKRPEYTDGQIAKFVDTKHRFNIDPVFFHALYLTNLASDKLENVEKASDALIYELNLAPRLEVVGSVLHTGSHQGRGFENTLPQVVKAITHILAESDPKSYLILENATGNNKIGVKLEELATILERVNSPRLKVCFDTCHGFTAGYNLRDPGIFNQTIDNMDRLFGLDNLVCLHANDSKDEFDSNRDRHQNIGEGTLGLEPFRQLVNHPKLKSIPLIIETPGFDGKGPDKKNLDILKSLANTWFFFHLLQYPYAWTG